MDYKMILWVGAAIVIGIVIKIISSLSDAKPEDLTRTKPTSKAYHRTEPTPHNFDDATTKFSRQFGEKQNKTASQRPATTFSSRVGSGGRFPVASLRGYKIALYAVHLVVYSIASLMGSILIIPIGFLLYKLTLSYQKNTNLDQLSPTEQQEFIQYTQSIKGRSYFLKIALPVYLFSHFIITIMLIALSIIQLITL